MDNVELMIDWHIDGARQGPGDDARTRLALDLAGIDRARRLTVADIGCGTGASAKVLASELDADIVAIDLAAGFIARLAKEIPGSTRGTIHPVVASMDALPLAPASLDLIWSEGAIYNLGFETGLIAWRDLLKPGGHLVVSEIAWTTPERPHELECFWQDAYPEIGTMAEKVAVLERCGFVLEACFVLPRECWTESYYASMKARRDDFLARHANAPAARDICDAELGESDLFDRYGDFYSYGMFIARRDDPAVTS